jgi:hypothetical protein
MARACLAMVTPNGERASVAGLSGLYTASALVLAGHDGPEKRIEYGHFTFLILSYMLGSFIAGLISPDAIPYQIEPRFGPPFLIGALCLSVASVIAALEVGDVNYIFYFAAAANGIQNGVASIYSANLIRCSLT